MDDLITPDNIISLKENEVFCFGSNLAGRHGAGAAKTALKWGAVMGEGFGLHGKTFAIPTKDENIETLPIEKIKPYVDKFIEFAKQNPDHKFLVTAIGTGLASYTPAAIAPLFQKAVDVKNISLPLSFWQVL